MAWMLSVPNLYPRLTVCQSVYVCTTLILLLLLLLLVPEFVSSSQFPLFNTAQDTRTSGISFVSNAILLVKGKGRVCDLCDVIWLHIFHKPDLRTS